jgi:hypothetical protein
MTAAFLAVARAGAEVHGSALGMTTVASAGRGDGE